MAQRRKLTAKQLYFVQHYLTQGRNASAAYRAAYNADGMKESTINHRAVELLKHGQIAAMIAADDRMLAKAHEARSERYVITKDWISHELAKLARGISDHPLEFIPASVRSQSLERLAKLHGLVIEKRDMRVVRSFADLSDEEIAALASEEGRSDAVRH